MTREDGLGHDYLINSKPPISTPVRPDLISEISEIYLLSNKI